MSHKSRGCSKIDYSDTLLASRFHVSYSTSNQSMAKHPKRPTARPADSAESISRIGAVPTSRAQHSPLSDLVSLAQRLPNTGISKQRRFHHLHLSGNSPTPTPTPTLRAITPPEHFRHSQATHKQHTAGFRFQRFIAVSGALGIYNEGFPPQ